MLSRPAAGLSIMHLPGRPFGVSPPTIDAPGDGPEAPPTAPVEARTRTGTRTEIKIDIPCRPKIIYTDIENDLEGSPPAALCGFRACDAVRLPW